MKRLRTAGLFRVLNRHQKKLSALEIADARDYFEKISRSRIKSKIHGVSSYQIGPNKTLHIRIYETGSWKNTTIIYFHGGGFVVGSIDSHDTVARKLSKAANSNVVSVGYRLAPENPYPAAVEDGVTTLEWLRGQNRVNNHHVYLAGDSAGAQIALYTFLKSKKAIRYITKGLILLYPALDPSLSSDSMQTYANKHFVTKSDMVKFWDTYLGGKKLQWPLTSEQIAVLPKTLIQTADYDILRDEGLYLANQINDLTGKCEYHCYPETTHGFMQIPHLISGSNKALKDIANFVNETK